MILKLKESARRISQVEILGCSYRYMQDMDVEAMKGSFSNEISRFLRFQETRGFSGWRGSEMQDQDETPCIDGGLNGELDMIHHKNPAPSCGSGR